MIRIVLTGSECTGKSTLARDLAEHYGVVAVPEYLREYFVEKNGVLTIEDAVPIVKGQLAGEREREQAGDNPLICDTNPLTSVIYNRCYYDFCPEWIEEQLTRRTYHHYLLCGIDVPWQADGQRDRPGDRDHMQSLFRAELIERGCPFTELAGDHATRLSRAKAVVDSLLE